MNPEELNGLTLTEAEARVAAIRGKIKVATRDGQPCLMNDLAWDPTYVVDLVWGKVQNARAESFGSFPTPRVGMGIINTRGIRRE